MMVHGVRQTEMDRISDAINGVEAWEAVDELLLRAKQPGEHFKC